MPRYMILASALLLAMACGDNIPAETSNVAENVLPAEPPYETLPSDRLLYIFDNATYSDMTFYNLPISTNQSTPEQVQASFANISGEAPPTVEGCPPPIGRVWYQVDGKNVEEADIYFGNNCAFYLWMEDGKPAYANMMTRDGVAFLQRVINSIPPDAQ